MFGLGLSNRLVAGLLYKGASRLGFRGVQLFSLKTILCSIVYHPSGDGDTVCQILEIAAEVLVFIKDYRAVVLRRVVYQYVACWIDSSSSGCVHRVIERLATWLTRCERSGQNSRITGVIRIRWY